MVEQNQQAGYVVGGGKAQSNAGLMRTNRKQSVLRKVTNNYPYDQFGNLADSSVGVPGMSSMFAPDNNEFPQDDHIVQGNCLIVANCASSELKLKYALINHSHG